MTCSHHHHSRSRVPTTCFERKKTLEKDSHQPAQELSESRCALWPQVIITSPGCQFLFCKPCILRSCLALTFCIWLCDRVDMTCLSFPYSCAVHSVPCNGLWFNPVVQRCLSSTRGGPGHCPRRNSAFRERRRMTINNTYSFFPEILPKQ